MSHMENTGESSGITGINNEQQDDVQSTPDPIDPKDPTAFFPDIAEALESAPGLKQNEPPTRPLDIARPSEQVLSPGQKQNLPPTTLRDYAPPNVRVQEDVCVSAPSAVDSRNAKKSHPSLFYTSEAEDNAHLAWVAHLVGVVGHENLINTTVRRASFLSNVGGCSHHRQRTPEFVPKVVVMIQKISRGYRLDEIIFEEKDLVFLRQLLEHILDAKNVNASRPDDVLEALTAAPPCHSRANANLFASIS